MADFSAARDWGRLLTAMVTPFDADGNVNYAEARRVASYLVDEQANEGLVVNGTTGESPTLKEDEKLRLLEEVLDEVGSRAAVVFGAGSYDTAESQHMTREGTKRGAHGIMLVNPYYSRPGQAGLEAHFRACAAETDLPVMLYNIMPRSAINLETSTLMRLIEVPNIVAVKEASGNMAQIAEVCANAPAGFRVYSGDDGLLLPVLSVGGYGLVSVAAHVVGKQMARIIKGFPSDASVVENGKEILPVIKAIFSAPSPVPVKYALSRAGFDTERVRLPLVPLTDAEKAVVDHALGMVSV
jgi:4-hydroxy-tetrahydrodipicolinate synthase